MLPLKNLKLLIGWTIREIKIMVPLLECLIFSEYIEWEKLELFNISTHFYEDELVESASKYLKKFYD